MTRQEYYQKNKEAIKVKRAAYYQKNKARINKRQSSNVMRSRNGKEKEFAAYMQSWRKRNKEKHALYARKYMKDYHEKHRERIRVTGAAYYAKNRERIAEYRKINKAKIAARESVYNKLHPERVRNASHIRRARMKGGKIGDVKLIKKWEGTWKKGMVNCFWCRKRIHGTKAHSDHILAISKGGAHSIENMCISCPSCNSSKNAASVSEWNQRIPEPVLL